MKIKFGYFEYEIVDICYSLDRWGKPIDIVITADEDTLIKISEFAMIGCNIQESYRESKSGEPLHEALFARLLEFEVVGAEKVYYQ